MTSAPPPAAPTTPPGPPGEPPAAQPPPPPGPPQWTARPPLRRSRNDKVLGGVAGGLAEYSGIDALLWRVGFVALAITGGFGLLAYVLLWLLMPAGPLTPYDPAATGKSERRPRRSAGPRSPVPGVTIAALLIVLGVLVLLTRFTGFDVGPRGFLGSALLVVGLGLVAAAFTTGRSARGGLIALGVLLSFALIGTSSVDWRDVRDGVGDRSYAPTSAEAVRSVYDNGVGDMRLDLSGIEDLDDLSRAIETRVDSGIGDVQIVVPRSADVMVTVDSGVGDVTLFDGRDADGGFFAGEGAGSWTGDGEPEIELTIDSGLGDVEVSRA